MDLPQEGESETISSSTDEHQPTEETEAGYIRRLSQRFKRGSK